jgi:N-acetylglucosaminyldiphosphoundecaprenol N-acetyl-beta-D-mannosaminyltransferase
VDPRAADGSFPGQVNDVRRRSTVRIGDVEVDDVTFDETVAWILEHASDGRGGLVSTPNADAVIRSRTDPLFRAATNEGDLRVPDGMWIVYASRIAGSPLRGTVTGRLLVPATAAVSASTGTPIALFGARPGVAERARDVLLERVPSALIVDAFGPSMGFEIGGPEDVAAVERIRGSGARIVFVALGAPKQEVWMVDHRADLPGVVIAGVGAALDVIAGLFREAPRWMTAIGLEWLVRLSQEPRRLGRRYLLEDPWIVWWALRTRVRLRRSLVSEAAPDETDIG